MEELGPDAGAEEAVDKCLAVFFYWVNFGALSRGTAACGYAVLLALLTGLGFAVDMPFLPPQKQLDWVRPLFLAVIDSVSSNFCDPSSHRKRFFARPRKLSLTTCEVGSSRRYPAAMPLKGSPRCRRPSPP